MEFLQESIALGVDLLVFGLCLKGYYNNKNIISTLKVNPTKKTCQLQANKLSQYIVHFIV